MDKNLKILLIAAIGLFLLGIAFIIVSTVTLYNDNELTCTFTGPCFGYVIQQEINFCCSLFSSICFAKFYCNGDTFTVNGLRYMGIGSAVIGIIVFIVFCCKKRNNPANYQQFPNCFYKRIHHKFIIFDLIVVFMQSFENEDCNSWICWKNKKKH